MKTLLENRWFAVGVLLAGGVVGYGARAAWAGGIPSTKALTYAGLLEDSTGKPITGSHPITVNVYDAATAGNLLCTVVASPTPNLVDGRFQVVLPDTCTTGVHANATTWTEVVVDGDSLGRSANGAVPYAAEAAHAVSADTAMSALTAGDGVPAGAVMAFNLSSCPSGWSAMNAAAGRVVVGASGSLGVGATAGSDSVTLTVAQMPSHSHGVSDPGHSHGLPGPELFVAWNLSTCSSAVFSLPGTSSPGAGCAEGEGMTNSTTNISIDSAGSDQAFDNRQASLALLYCQKS